MRRPVLWSALLAFAAVLPSSAELVVLADGSTLKVRSVEVVDERAALGFANGGRMVIGLERIERIVDDEVEDPRPVEIAAEVPTAPEPPTIALDFTSDQAVPPGPYGPAIFAASERHRVNPSVVAAVVRAESSGNPRAVSRKGARGLMQLMPATAARFGVPTHRLFEPEQNLEAGVRYLKFLIGLFPNDLARVLAAYNAGEQAVVRYGGIPPYRETKGYVRRIYSFLGLTLAEPRG